MREARGGGGGVEAGGRVGARKGQLVGAREERREMVGAKEEEGGKDTGERVGEEGVGEERVGVGGGVGVRLGWGRGRRVWGEGGGRFGAREEEGVAAMERGGRGGWQV